MRLCSSFQFEMILCVFFVDMQASRLYSGQFQLPDVQLDKLLWEFLPDCFIPHDIGVDESGSVPFIQVADLQRLSSPAEMLLNLSSTVPEQLERYQRVAEIVPDNPIDRQPMRDRFRHYRNLGCTPDYHPIN